jgi:hypothetical protein
MGRKLEPRKNVWVALARRPGDPAALVAYAISPAPSLEEAEEDFSAVAGTVPLGYISARMALRDARTLGPDIVFATRDRALAEETARRGL